MISPGKRRPTGAGRAALHAYRQTPLSTRVHATVRWWSAPFPAVQAELPAAGRVLEIGCGHGLFSTYLALADRSRSVVGVDIDAAKIAQARAVADLLPGVDLHFVRTASGEVPPGPWDAVVVIDMLYLLPAAEQRSLLAQATAQLADGGALLIKEMSSTPRWKAGWNRLQETVAVSILGITERADGRSAAGRARFDFVPPDVMANWLQEAGLSTTSKRLDRRRLHPHHLLIGRRDRTAAAR